MSSANARNFEKAKTMLTGNELNQSVENAGVAFVEGTSGRNASFEKINKQ